jgi:LmbE family N-acetylglucosaminyl deacetylase
MSALQLANPRTILCVGAHCDDIEIGCGATIATWATQFPTARFVWCVFSGDPTRTRETRAAAAALVGDQGRIDFVTHQFRDSYFPADWGSIKDAFRSLRDSVEPDVILTHHEHDRHQDHRLLAELSWNAFRHHFILEYEIPKYDGDLGRPNVFVPVSRELAARKVEVLLTQFASQRERSWFTADTFMGLMRLRGIECGSAAGFAEAFFSRKLLLGT